MITINFENVDNIKEAQDTEFGFNGRCGVIRNDEGLVIGFYTISIDEPELTLQELEILEEYRDMGYGREFLKKLFEEYPTITEITGQSTEDACSFYAHLGVMWGNTCEGCCDSSCFHNLIYMGNREQIDYAETCDDYSDNIFMLKKDLFL